MAKRVPTLLATAVAAACSLSAHANGPTQADYAKVVLYSNVTIAQDSASQWGIWEELEPTAAGPQTPLPLLAGAVDPYRPVGVVTPPATPPVTPPTLASGCASGSLCGFGVITYQSFTYNPEQVAAADVNIEPGIELPALNMGFRLTPKAVEPTKTFTESDPLPTNWLPAAMTISTEGIRQDGVEQAPKFTAEEIGVMNFRSPNQHSTVGSESATASASMGTDTTVVDADATSGMFTGGSIMSYVNGGMTIRSAAMHGFWGVTTTAADMNALRLANAQANYSGFTFGANGAPTGIVNMVFQLGAGTFTGDFGAPLGGSLSVSNPLQGTVGQTQSGVSQVNSGYLIFQVSGKVNGSQFSSDTVRIAGNGNSITGKVEGALFGSQAKVAAGTVDVTATLGARPSTPPATDTALPAKVVPTAPQVVRYSTAFYTTKQPEVELKK